MNTPDECTDLEQVRTEIDDLDARLLAILAQRMRFADRAADFKTCAEDVAATERVRALLADRQRQATELGIDLDLVRRLFEDIVAQGQALQTRRLQQND